MASAVMEDEKADKLLEADHQWYVELALACR